MPRPAPASGTRHPYRYGPELTPVGADNPETPPSPRGPPGPRGLGCHYGGRCARFDTQTAKKFRSAIASRIRPAAAGESGLPRPGPGFPPPDAEPDLRT